MKPIFFFSCLLLITGAGCPRVPEKTPPLETSVSESPTLENDGLEEALNDLDLVDQNEDADWSGY